MKTYILVIIFIFANCFVLQTVEARGRTGSHRVGGYGSHGKKSHYVGGHVGTGKGKRKSRRK